MDVTTAVGALAATCTTISYAPQLKKCWQTGHSGDLSLGMFLTLAGGVAVWVAYGFLISDYVVIAANVVSLMLLLCILYFKVREMFGAGRHMKAARTAVAPTADRLRIDIDRGTTGDKVDFPDPAAAPLGTDDEAGGNPPQPQAVALAHARETRRSSTEPRQRGIGAAWLLIAFVGLCALGTVPWILFR